MTRSIAAVTRSHRTQSGAIPTISDAGLANPAINFRSDQDMAGYGAKKVACALCTGESADFQRLAGLVRPRPTGRTTVESKSGATNWQVKDVWLWPFLVSLYIAHVLIHLNLN